MMSKLLTLVKSKVAAAALGVLLVGGSGGAVAMAATQGNLNGLQLQMGASSSKSQAGHHSGDHSGAKNRGHAEGMLTACDASANTITVTDAQGAATTFTVNSGTTFNGYIHGNDRGDSTSASNPTFTLTDLCKLVNKVRVQVQATASTSGGKTTYTATKVTVQGPGTENAGDSHGKPDGAGKPSDLPTPNDHSSTGSDHSGAH
jgi:hypothetical protein